MKTIQTRGKLALGIVKITSEFGFNKVSFKAKPGAIVYGFSIEKSQSGIIYDALGIIGARVVDLYNNAYNSKFPGISELFFAIYDELKPDFFAVTYGTNELMDTYFNIESFKKSFEGVIKKLKIRNKNTICAVFAPPDFNRKKNNKWQTIPRLNKIVQAEQEVAKKQGCIFFNTFKFMGGEGSMHIWYKKGYASHDHTHLTAKGYKAVGKEFYRLLMINFYEYVKQNKK